ncbi:E3 ubiquitin-protein ligase MARCHF1-like isoform X1 [Clytia hemisphaerica]
MEVNCKSRYHLKISTDQRVYKDWKKNGGGPIEIKYADNCKKCKRHKKNLIKQKKRKYDVYKHSLQNQPPPEYHSRKNSLKMTTSKSSEDGALHIMSIPRVPPQKEWDPRMTMTSPIEWETSPLVTADEESDMSTTIINTSTRPDVLIQNKGKHLPDVISNNEAQRQEDEETDRESSIRSCATHKPRVKKSRSVDVAERNVTSTPKKCRSRSIPTDQSIPNKYTKSSTTDENEHFIIVNIPENAFKPGMQNADIHNHNTILSIADDTATVVSEGVKCRYCLTNDTINNEPLISPCHCCGTSKFVHQSCLEKWLTLRNLDHCEVCKMHYRTKWVHRPLCSLNFPSMKKHDVFLLILTVAFYVTLIFQFLGAVYVSIMASALTPMVTIVTLIGLSLGLIWFLTGSIALTIILYTSEYWKAWRKANKRKILLTENARDIPLKSPTSSFPSDLSQAVAV